MNNEDYILGIDGGGTNTKVCLFNSDGKTILELKFENRVPHFMVTGGKKNVCDLELRQLART